MSKELHVFYDWHSRIMYKGHPEICESHDHIKFVGDGTMVCGKCYAMVTNCPSEDGYDLMTLSKHLVDRVIIGGKMVRQFTAGYERVVRLNEYYATLQWEAKREQVIHRDGGRCRLCFNPADQVHHASYKRVGKENLLDLTLLCKSCHTFISQNKGIIQPEKS